MQFIRGLHNLAQYKAAFSQGCVLTIGNFDGVHLGHQSVLHQVQQLATQNRLPSVVMIFEPLPIEYFAQDKAPVRLMNLREKLMAFQQTQIDYVLLMPFNQSFFELTASDFVEQILVNQLNVKHLVEGKDFRFGHQRQGDFSLLVEMGQRFGFTVTDLSTYLIDALRVSSTRIRQALSIPDLPMSETLLGRPFSFNGRVIHGKKLGRQIGFRTLNLNPKRDKMPVSGVYAVKVAGIAERDWEGVANIGVRPTVNGLRPSIEVHLFNWQKDLYGCHVTVKLAAFIRAEKKFDGIEALTQQIRRDAQQARAYLGLEVEAVAQTIAPPESQ